MKKDKGKENRISRRKFIGTTLSLATGYDPIPFIRDHHEQILSMHLKDRTTPANGQEDLMWGQGDTPITEILQLIRDEGYNIYPTVEFEYDIPEGSNAVIEVARCLAYCRNALAV